MAYLVAVHSRANRAKCSCSPSHQTTQTRAKCSVIYNTSPKKNMLAFYTHIHIRVHAYICRHTRTETNRMLSGGSADQLLEPEFREL
jgi:hypothetical protein